MNEIEIFRELDLVEECPVINNFSNNVYTRTVFMPKGAIIVGKKHKTRHLNMIMTGKARVWMDGRVLDISAPDILESHEGCRKILYIVEDMYWTTVHPTDKTDLEEIEEMLIEPDIKPIEFNDIIKELKCLGLQ
jgi:hypothetical protein